MIATKTLTALLSGIALVAAPLAPGRAAPVQEEGGGETGGEEEAAGGEELEEEEEGERWLAIVGADVYAGDGNFLRGASLLARNGKITEIGYDLYVPEEAEVIEADGLRAYPGLVAYDSQGLLGTTRDFADSVDPFSDSMLLALASGITTAAQSSTAFKLKRGEIEGVVLRDGYLASQTWSNRTPGSKASLRDDLAKAAEYLRKHRIWEEKKKDDKDLKEPSSSGVKTPALKILKGEILAKFSTNDRDELLGIARLAQTYRFRPVIEGAGEGWSVADELGRAGAIAIVTPRWRSNRDERQVREGGSSIENAARLHAAGVQVAIVPASTGITTLMGIAGRDILHMPIEAGFAVRGGLPETAALDALTLVPARALGVDHRVGSLEVGKDCDVILTDGDLLHYQTFVQLAVVDGKVAYDKSEELFFAHIRPREEGEAEEAEPEPAAPDDVTDPED